MTGSVDELRRSGSRWRAACLALAALLLCVAGVLGYTVLDLGISLSYARAELDYTRRDLAVLRGLTPTLRVGDSRSDVLVSLRRQHPDALITATDSTVGIGELVFRFDADGRLRQVALLNEH